MLDPALDLTEKFEQAYRVNDTSRSGDISIHVSSLLDFCPRAYHLCKKNDFAYYPPRYPSIAEGYTFDLGYAVQDIQISRLMSLKEGPIFGGWECRHCGRLEYGLQEKGRRCPKCKCRAWEPKDLRMKVPFKVKGKVIFEVTGSVDYGVLYAPRKVYFVDSKSIKAKGCPKCPDKSDDFDTLKDASLLYRRQVQLYMHWGNHKDRVFVGEPREGADETEFNSEVAAIAYGCKGYRSMPLKAFTVQQDQEFVQSTEKALQQLAKHIANGTEPPKICENENKSLAKACVAKALCFGSPFWSGRKTL